jgi:hypothetical protein
MPLLSLNKGYDMKLILAILGFTAVTAYAGDTWLDITAADATDKMQIKVDSFEVTKKASDKQLSLIFKTIFDNKQSFYKATVNQSECVKKYGMLRAYKFDGKLFFETSFTFDGGNTGSMLAELICGVYQDQIKGNI